MNYKAKRLFDILSYAVALKEYQKGYQNWPDGTPKTFCNLFCKGILNFRAAIYWVKNYAPVFYSYDITSMNPGKYLVEIMRETDTMTAYENVGRMAKSGLATEETHDAILPKQAQKYPIEIDELIAYNYSNMGIPVWVVSAILPPVGHEAIVCPSDEDYDESRGVRIAQAGWINGMFWMNQIFSSIWRTPKSDIKYFIFPEE